jgi:hypothetical protein
LVSKALLLLSTKETIARGRNFIVLVGIKDIKNGDFFCWKIK